MPMGYVNSTFSRAPVYIQVLQGVIYRHIGVGFRRCSFRREGNARASGVGRVDEHRHPRFFIIYVLRKTKTKSVNNIGLGCSPNTKMV